VYGFTKFTAFDVMNVRPFSVLSGTEVSVIWKIGLT
jgi:hypothetical protein